ncbi:hypothetical protein D9619_012022 [Psilocybe cf. subviscida]|uniref:UBA domain-containing protein n=1 Tax=Psilocybe cf. subviscida TaxID=2480587 RepID=A0A8H5EZG0_9AGAR|nr:hypothetical protein D9619_012022 [Psilocybe cf. subviscida]
MRPLLAKELYYEIIHYLSAPSDLKSLALTCADFRAEAQRILFRTVAPTSRLRQSQFISIINESPSHFGPWVHTLRILFAPTAVLENLDISEEDLHFERGVASALRSMSNLKRLHINQPRPRKLLEGCSFKLQSLVFSGRLGHRDLVYLLRHFLPTQLTLKHLEVHRSGVFSDDQAGNIRNILCPTLESLGVDRVRMCEVLLPSTPNARLIKRFQWYDTMIPPPLSVTQLKGLECLLFKIESEMDTSFTRHLTSLIVMELHTDLIMFGAPPLATRIKFLKDIPHLQTLVLDLYEEQPYSPYHETEWDIQYITAIETENENTKWLSTTMYESKTSVSIAIRRANERSSTPVTKPQTLSSLNSNSGSSSSTNTRGSSNPTNTTQAPTQRKTPDVFALLASKSTSSSNAYRPQVSAQPISRTTTASPASLSSTPAYLTSHSQPASRPSSTQPAASTAGSRSKDAFGDLFSSASGSSSPAPTSNMTLAARARMEQEHKLRQMQRGSSNPATATFELDAWTGLDALGGGGGAPPIVASRSGGRGTARVDDIDDWGLGDFGAVAPASTSVPRSTSKAGGAKTGTRTTAIIDGMEDDWGLGDFGSGGGSSSSTTTAAPVSTSIPAPQDEDDILGMLSRPVEDVRAAKVSISPSPPIASRRSPLPSSTPSTSATPAPSRDPPPHILGQIVEMGFSVAQARNALLSSSSSDTSQEWDVQAALEMLLGQGEGQSPAGGASRAETPLQSVQHAPRHAPQQAPQPAPEGRAPPKGRRERDLERQERLARLEREIAASASASGPSASGSTSRTSDSTVVPAELAQHAERVLEMGKVMGRGVLGKASAFWREGRERVGKALEERGGVGVPVAEGRAGQGQGRGMGTGRGGAKGVPKWMQEHPDDEHAGEDREDREHVMGGYADGDERHQGWDDDAEDSRAEAETKTHARERERERPVEPEVDLFNAGDDGVQEPTRATKIEAEAEVDLFSMPAPTRPVAGSSTSASRGASSSASAQQATRSSANSSRARPSASMPSSRPTPTPTRQRALIPASSSAISQAASHRTAGTASFKLGQYADAAAAYSRAIDALPEGHLLRVPLLTNRALALMRTGECKGAERDCAEAVRVVVGLPSATTGAADAFDTASNARPDPEAEATVDSWSPAQEPADLIEAGRAKANDAGWADAQRGEGVGVDLVDGYIKARRRRAEALEMQEKWRAAAKDWDVLAGAAWVPEKVRGEARTGVGRCRRMLGEGGSAGSGGAGASSSSSSRPNAPPPVAPKPKPRVPARPTPAAKTSAAGVPTGAALKALQTSTAQAEAEDNLRHTLKDGVDARLAAWRGGKETNIRALLASLDIVLWPEILAGGVQVSGLGALITPAQVKKGYVKAIARVHPDKLSPSNSTVEQRMLANGVFGTLNEAWIAFQAGAK